MDSSEQSTNSPAGDLRRFERPLPPIPTPDSDFASVGESQGRVAEFQGLSTHEENIGLDDQQQHKTSESSTRSNNAASLLTQGPRSSAVGLAMPQSQSASNDDLYVSGDSQIYRTSSIHERGSARSLRGDDNSEGIARSRSPSQTLIQALQLPRPNPSRTPSNGSDSDGSYRDSPHTSLSQIRRRQRRGPSSEPTSTDFVVPRWQPDAEVTMCPICRTQFSFFIRKHHCRKCGRVVCNSCSPHRITIPYQYIVQPPVEGVPSTPSTRPTLDEARAGSSNEAGSLGGGERVRLCNPCVPDPNTAPPQTSQRQLIQRQQSHNHSRSASTATSSYNNPGNYRTPEEVARLATNFHRRVREPSIFVGRPTALSTGGLGAPYTEREDRGLRPDGDSRSRSSTVGSSRDPINQSLGSPNPITRNSPSGTQQQYRPLIPRMDDGAARVSPSSPRHPQRARIPEEDECWICHKELPSRELPSFETLRANHVQACIDAIMSPIPSLSPAPPVVPTATRVSRGESSSSASQAQGSTTAIPTPVANTPEARTAAREQAHAAVVFGRSRTAPPGPARRTGVFPYQATEKDCVDDAECTICLEEFVIGVEMGRLECFCRFHLHCIRQWFEAHPGQCPVHQHGAGF